MVIGGRIGDWSPGSLEEDDRVELDPERAGVRFELSLRNRENPRRAKKPLIARPYLRFNRVSMPISVDVEISEELDAGLGALGFLGDDE